MRLAVTGTIWHYDRYRNSNHFDNGKSHYTGKESTMEEQIKAKLEEMRGMLQADGGDMELVSIDGTDVLVKLKGACGGCPHAMVTLKQGIEQVLRRDVDPAIVVERAED